MVWLPVSGLVQHVKKLQVLTPYPHDQKKAKQAGNQQLFLDPSENWADRKNCCLKNWEDQKLGRKNFNNCHTAGDLVQTSMRVKIP